MKLLLEEDSWEHVSELWTASDEIVSSRLTYVETRAALERARRSDRLPGERLGAVKADFGTRWHEIFAIEPVEPLIVLAADIAERYGLRAYDAVHLASALALEDPELWFLTWDGELSDAASAAGLAVAP